MSIDEIRAAYYASKVNDGPDKQDECRKQLIAALNVESDTLKNTYNIIPGESVKATYQRLQKELMARHKREQEELTALRLSANKAKKIIDAIKAEISTL